MKLNYYNDKTGSRDSIVIPNTNIEQAIIDNCILKYGEDSYILTKIGDWSYRLNDYIACEVFPSYDDWL